MGDWQRASMVPELSISLLKASQLAVAMRGASTGHSLFGNLPPEPTLKDLAALGSLQEKVSLLDSTVGQLQENLRLKEQELLSVHRELEDKTRHAQELAVKLGGVEERLSAVGELRQNLDAAVAAEHEMESTITRQSGVIDELTKQIESLRTEKAQLELSQSEKAGKLGSDIEALRTEMRGELEELKNRPVPAPAASGPMPSMPVAAAPSPFGAPPAAAAVPAAFDAPKPGGLPSLGGPSAGLGLPTERPADSPFGAAPAAGLSEPAMNLNPAPAAALGEPASPFGAQPAVSLDAPPPGAGPGGLVPPGLPDAAGSPFGGGFTAPPSTGLSAVPFNPVADAPIAAAPAPADVPSSMTGNGDLAAPPKKGGAGKVVMIMLLLSAVGGGAAFKMGMLDAYLKGAPAAEAPLPPPVETPKGPTPEEQAEQLKQQAVELVRTWPAGAGTLGSQLETAAVAAGGLSPWQADRVKDGIYQVNFYSPKSSGGTGQTFEFEADLAMRRVTARNDAAVAALAGGKKQSLASKRKPKIRPKQSDEGAMLGDLLGGTDLNAEPKKEPEQPKEDSSAATTDNPIPGLLDGESPKPARSARRKQPQGKPEESLDDLLSGSKEPRKRKGKEEESLDQILLPGIPRRPQDLDEPQAKPSAPAGEGAAEASVPVARKPAVGKKPAKQAADAELLDDLLKP